MVDEGDIYIGKAQESLAGAESEFAAGRYNNVANRAYYACFQAAIAALIRAGIRPAGDRDEWDHGFVQAQFAGHLIHRRKLYQSDLREVLTATLTVRAQGDYRLAVVSQRQATRSLAYARTFVAAVAARKGSHS